MHTPSNLHQSAINAAKQQDWALAMEMNQQILALNPNDIGALNRLGVAQLQLGEIAEASTCFNKVLELDRSNTIAKKHLLRIKNNQVPSVPSFSTVYFIEEPGKTKIAELHRLAGKATLDILTVGQTCELKPKNRYISVESKGSYIGSLPEDLSFRLSKLIAGGNEYNCYVHTVSANSCSIYLKEAHRSEKNQYIHSFPVVKGNLATINDIDQSMLFEDNIPVMIGDVEESTESYSDMEMDSDES